MTKTIWVTKVTYEKNSSDGIDYFTCRDALADHVYLCEQCGGKVQVYECVPVLHEVYASRVSIELSSRQSDNAARAALNGEGEG